MNGSIKKNAAGGRAHPSPELIRRYVEGDEQIDVWAVEAHLENCVSCRLELAVASRDCPPVSTLIDTVWTNLDIQVSSAPVHRRAPRRWTRRLAVWASPAMLPWMLVSVVVMGLALLVDLGTPQSGSPSLVLLLAPVAPVFGVAASWARVLDPAHELVAGTPRAGLYLVLRRTLAVLAVAIPASALAGWAVDASPVRWLLPSLAFTVGTLALGSVFGVWRAAIGLLSVWSVFVIGPSVFLSRLPVVLEPGSLPVWGAAVVLGAVVVVARSGAYNNLVSQR